jgi:hypothetical protein
MHDIAQKQIFKKKTTRAGFGSGFGGEISGSGSGKKVGWEPASGNYKPANANTSRIPKNRWTGTSLVSVA